MKATHWLVLSAAALFPLTGCEKTATEKKIERVEQKAADTKENIDHSAEQAKENVEAQAEAKKEAIEREGERIEDAAENTAERLRKEADEKERAADAVEDAAKDVK